MHERVSDELLMSSNLYRVKRSTFKKLLKLLSAEMPVIWKPMTQLGAHGIICWLRLTSWLLKTRIMVMESRKDEPCLWNANANWLNYTKKRQSLHPIKNLPDALIITLVWLCSKRMQRKDSHTLLALSWITLISEALILASSYSTSIATEITF